MSVARTKLKLARSEHLQPVADGPSLAADADLGGLGLDWDTTPRLAGVALAAWQHLAATFRDQPTRFREADRSAVVAFCEVAGMRALAAEQLQAEGLAVQGRSEHDRARLVKNPAWSMWRDADTALRAWSNALGLNPTARRRAGIAEAPASPINNPFAPRG